MKYLSEVDLPRVPFVGKLNADGGNRSVPTSYLEDCIVAGEELHPSLMSLAYRGASQERLEELMDQSAAKDADKERWRKRRRDIPRLIRSAESKKARWFERHSATMPPPDKPTRVKPKKQALQLPQIAAAEFSKRPHRLRDWVVDVLIPKNETTLFYGPGSAGKSLLLLQLAIGFASGAKWLGRDVPKGRVVFFTCEDDADEIKRRGDAILKSLGLTWSDLGDRLMVIPMRDSEASAVLAAQLRDGQLTTTATYEALQRALQAYEPDLVIIDTLADTFAGNENDRGHAKQFIKQVEMLIRATFIVTAHPSVTGQHDGRGSSGSTGWPAAVRSHLYLERDDKDDDLRRLSLKKANYSKLGDADVLMRWQDGVFHAVSRMETLNAAHQAEELFQRLLGEYRDRDRFLNPTSGTSYAPTVFAQDEEVIAAGFDRRDMREAMNRLEKRGQIAIRTRRVSGHDREYLELIQPESGPPSSDSDTEKTQ